MLKITSKMVRGRPRPGIPVEVRRRWVSCAIMSLLVVDHQPDRGRPPHAQHMSQEIIMSRTWLTSQLRMLDILMCTFQASKKSSEFFGGFVYHRSVQSTFPTFKEADNSTGKTGNSLDQWQTWLEHIFTITVSIKTSTRLSFTTTGLSATGSAASFLQGKSPLMCLVVYEMWLIESALTSECQFTCGSLWYLKVEWEAETFSFQAPL